MKSHHAHHAKVSPTSITLDKLPVRTKATIQSLKVHFFNGVLWPDFSVDHLKAALEEFSRRDRRYGGTPADGVLAAG